MGFIAQGPGQELGHPRGDQPAHRALEVRNTEPLASVLPSARHIQDQALVRDIQPLNRCIHGSEPWPWVCALTGGQLKVGPLQ